MEIERKWMLKGWPPEELGLPLLYEQSMRQGYISVRPTVRIREMYSASSPVQALSAKRSRWISQKTSSWNWRTSSAFR